ncbi:MAG: hypothetical protein ABIF08_03880 [Nanoarchaeota archaeon]
MRASLRIGLLALGFVLIIIASGCVRIKEVDFKQCDSDSDCISVPDGCCTCSNGGKATSINKALEKQYIDSRHAKCLGIMCPMIISSDPTCFAKPKCIENQCTI